MQRLLRSNLLFFLLLLLAIIFRLVISPTAYHIDILSNAGWGQWLYTNGPRHFYTNNIWIYSWPTQPPLVNLVYELADWLYIKQFDYWLTYWSAFIIHHHVMPQLFGWYFVFVKWMKALYFETPFQNGFLLSIKLVAILADTLIASLLYLILRRRLRREALAFTALFLFFPFSWYISALWGQYDGVGFFFVLAAFGLFYKRWTTPGVVALAMSVLLKPTSLILLPMFGFLFVMNRPKWHTWFLSLGLVGCLFVATTLPFVHGSFFHFVWYDLRAIIFAKAEMKLTNNAFNLWFALVGTKPADQNTQYLLVPAVYWGYAFYIGIFGYCLAIVRIRTFARWALGLFVLGIGAWLFMTNMLDRYAYAGIMFGLLTMCYYRKLLPYWLIFATIFSINLYHQWWVPSWLDGLKFGLIWHGEIVSRLLAALNVTTFCVMLVKIKMMLWPTIN